MPPAAIPPWLAGTWMPTPGVVVRLTGRCPFAVEKRFPNAGVSALLAASKVPPGEMAISSTRVVPPVLITAAALPGLVGLVNWKTLSVLLPSPA